ncbi:MAG: glycosyltransferase, partial [Acidimicrobiaceae bacterium]
MTSPVISVIVASYNQEKYISRCLRSLISQTISRDKFEIVVINDGSTDRSASV